MMIRKLKASEIDLLAPIGHAFTESVNYPGGFSLEALRQTWIPLLDANVGAVFTAWEADGFSGDTLIGAFGAVFGPDPFSGWLTAAEQWWFVMPEHRKSTAGIRLFRAFEEEAELRGCRKLMMITLAGKFEDSLSRLYESKGYVPVEKSFWKLV